RDQGPQRSPMRHSHRRNYHSPPHDEHRRSPRSDEERHIGPLTRRVIRVPLPVGLEKPPLMDTYDGSADPDDHIENIEVVLDYRGAQG
ncbi:hypothetical protein A2U01_0082883, partial [Trifolium medium]|nr:hypothetical protein [Trifolium medium]